MAPVIPLSPGAAAAAASGVRAGRGGRRSAAVADPCPSLPLHLVRVPLRCYPVQLLASQRKFAEDVLKATTTPLLLRGQPDLPAKKAAASSK
jgi:hypothetical protein